MYTGNVEENMLGLQCMHVCVCIVHINTKSTVHAPSLLVNTQTRHIILTRNLEDKL